ncbi:MAG: hypothetical protein AAGE52_37775 [Myxococcota bacterium]
MAPALEAPRRLPGRGGVVAAGLLAIASMNCSGESTSEPEPPPADTTGDEEPVEVPDESDDGSEGTVGEPEDPIAVPAYGVAPSPPPQQEVEPPPDDQVVQPMYGVAPE